MARSARPSKRVANLVEARRVRDRVDREVTPRQVVLERHAELDLGVSPVRFDVPPKGRDLVHLARAVEHANGPEVDSDGDRPPVAEHLSHLRRRRRRRQIPVEMRVPEQSIPNRSAHAPRLEPGALEGVGDFENRWRGLKLHWPGQGNRRRGAGPVENSRAWITREDGPAL